MHVCNRPSAFSRPYSELSWGGCKQVFCRFENLKIRTISSSLHKYCSKRFWIIYFFYFICSPHPPPPPQSFFIVQRYRLIKPSHDEKPRGAEKARKAGRKRSFYRERRDQELRNGQDMATRQNLCTSDGHAVGVRKVARRPGSAWPGNTQEDPGLSWELSTGWPGGGLICWLREEQEPAKTGRRQGVDLA
jgi:hypothetical protein